MGKRYAKFNLVIWLLAMASLAVAGWLIRGMFFQKGPANNAVTKLSDSKPNPSQPNNEFFAINGLPTTKSIAETRPFAVVVENHPDSRPQSGLIDADMVYETLAEGGITRFMAVYQSKETKNVGPVRSARTYFADLANELHAVFVHVGGNSDALENIKNEQYKNISDADQFFNDPYFVRANFRPMPHNVYTSTALLLKLVNRHEYNQLATFGAWKFKDDEKATATAASITVPFSQKSYEVMWKYNPATNSYSRFMAGSAHTDLDTKKQIQAKVIIVQSVETFPVTSDTIGAIGLTLLGQGTGYVFQDGKVEAVTWKKTGDGRTRYYFQNGNEAAFNRGQIWVELLPKELRVTWK